MKRKRTEIVVGIVTIAAFFLLVLVTVNLKKTLLFGKRYEINVYFKSVKGLAVGAPVHVYGMEAGEVKKIEYVKGEYPARVVLSIKKGLRLFKNANIRIVTTGLIGETSIEIDAGTSEAMPLTDGDHINGIEALDLYQVLAVTPDIAANISAILQSFRELITDEENRQALSNTIRRLDRITLQLERTLGESGQDIKQVLTNLNTLSMETRDLLNRIDLLLLRTEDSFSSASQSVQQALGKVHSQIDELGEEMHSVLQELQSSASSVESFLTENRQSIGEASRKLRLSTEKINSILDKIERGEGTLSQLINDPTPFYELRDIIRGLRGWLYNIPESRFDTTIPYEER